MPQGGVSTVVGSGSVQKVATSKLWSSAKIYDNTSAYDDVSRYQGLISVFSMADSGVTPFVGSGGVGNF